MRLNEREIRAITDTAAAVFGPDASVRLFGSRVDDRRRGGDIDLYVEVGPGLADWQHEAAFSNRLQCLIGEQKIDILLHEKGTPPGSMHRIAQETGALLDMPERPDGLSPEEPTLPVKERSRQQLADDLRAAAVVANGLAGSRQDLAHLFPVDAPVLAGIDRAARTMLYGLLKQYEVLEDIMDRRIFRAVMSLEGEDLEGRSARDVRNRLEALGAIESADAWWSLVELRNRVAHDYPLQPDLQARRLNEVHAGIGQLLDALHRIERYVARKSLLEGPG